jgi:site-specific DNA-methyltransferase (adenine-specific)
MSKIEIILGDCLEVMKNYPDNYFDLVLTDPPYGIDVIDKTYQNKKTKPGKALAHKTVYEKLDWDREIPTKEVFTEMMRVSKNQIIFGGNYFVEYLSNSPCWIVWDKNNGENDFADRELAWTSFKSAVRRKLYTWNGMIQHDMKNKEQREHPTQKPLPLMRWCLEKYSKEGDKILDPFAGSGTTLRAAKDMGRDCVGIEINPTYVEIIKQRERQEVLL